jgi:DNA polymerase-3 subunit beta
MKFTIHRDNLMPAFALLGGVPQKRAVIPVYGMFRLEAADDKLTVSANNMEIAATSSMPCETETPGTILAPAHRIIDFVSACDTELAFSVANERLTVRAGRSRIETPIANPADFPRVEFHDPIVQFTLSAAIWQAALVPPMLSIEWENVAFPALGGVLMHGTGEYVNLIGTNGKLLSVVRVLPLTQEFKTILPHGICLALGKLGAGSDIIEVAITNSIARFRGANSEFLTKLIDANYPDYERLIVPQEDKPITFSGSAMLQSLLRCVSVIDTNKSQTRGVTLTVTGDKIAIYSGLPSEVEFFDEISGGGGSYEATFNIAFLRDSLLAFGNGQVEIHASNPNMIRLNAVGASHDCAIIACMRSTTHT